MCMLETKGKQQLAIKVKVKGSGEGNGKDIFGKRSNVCKDTEVEVNYVYLGNCK